MNRDSENTNRVFRPGATPFGSQPDKADTEPAARDPENARQLIRRKGEAQLRQIPEGKDHTSFPSITE